MIADEVSRGALNPEFRARFKANPREVLREMGYNILDKIQLRVSEDTATTMNFTLPIDGWVQADDAKEIDRLRAAASGVCNTSASSAGCCLVADE